MDSVMRPVRQNRHGTGQLDKHRDEIKRVTGGGVFKKVDKI